MKAGVALCVLVLAWSLGGFRFAHDDEASERGEQEQASKDGQDELPTVSRSSSDLGGLHPILRCYRSPTLWVTAHWWPNEESKTFAIERHEPLSGETESFSYGSSFRIELVAPQKHKVAQKTQVFYVLGTTDAGDQVIERWTHKPNKNQFPGQPTQYVMKRKLIHSGASLGTIERIGVEPSGAYLILVHSDMNRHVSEVLLTAGYPVRTIIDGASGPTGLENGVQSLGRALHQTEGLLWMLGLPSGFPQSVVVLRDLSGDGLVDDWTPYDYDDHMAYYPPYYQGLPWVDNFRSYW